MTHMEANIISATNYKTVRAGKEQTEWIFNKHWKDPVQRQRARERFNNHFDMFFWKHLSAQNTAVTAGLRII